MAEWAGHISIDPVAAPREVADAVAVLAGDRASFITGTEFRIDGGLLATVARFPRPTVTGRRRRARPVSALAQR